MAKQITLNQLGVMIESIDNKVKAVSEGHEIIRSEMQQMEQRLSERIEDNSLKIGAISKKLDSVHTSLKNEINITAMAINDKLDEHIKQPSHAA